MAQSNKKSVLLETLEADLNNQDVEMKQLKHEMRMVRGRDDPARKLKELQKVLCRRP